MVIFIAIWKKITHICTCVYFNIKLRVICILKCNIWNNHGRYVIVYKNKKNVYIAILCMYLYQVDEMIDHSIEIESNKRIRTANVNPWTLHFKDPNLENRFCTMKEDMFKSNMMCCLIIWVFIILTQAVILPKWVIENI